MRAHTARPLILFNLTLIGFAQLRAHGSAGGTTQVWQQYSAMLKGTRECTSRRVWVMDKGGWRVRVIGQREGVEGWVEG